ncbi:MAG TPA: 4-hydroxy-tetrahydrodipicolinate reductase [Casimicrobiaceae bacterium]|nr:4-hydroxy-tetrahydrodipicolinate reductase [Casimicrobiaceae bacterium]
MTVRLAIAGAGGRMGQALVEAVLADPGLVLASALDAHDSPALGRDAGERIGRASGVIVDSDVSRALAAADVLIDFTRPAGTLAHVAACEAAQVAIVVGTTGLDDAAKARLRAAGERIPVVFAANMSIGVNVLLELTRLAAQRLGGAFDIEVLEMHHRHKVDAPSGTALALGEAAAEGLAVPLAEHAVYERHGVTGERQAGAIGFAALRGGDVVGEHTVIFAGPGERVELTHRATSRQNFAAGALRAARFVAQRRAQGHAGFFTMADVLELGTRT